MDPRIQTLCQEYLLRTGLPVAVCDRDGHLTGGVSCCVCPADDDACRQARRLAFHETARWGEPFLHLCPRGRLLWGIPLMNNAEITGGLVVDGVRIEEDSAERESARIRQSALLLQKMAEEANLTNAAHLELRRREADRESRRAEAIHELKGRAYDSIREIYLREEAGLMSAIRRGDRSEARAILNRILVGIYFFGRGRQDLLKSFILELVVSMSRSAVEAGADPAGVLGANYSSLVRLSRIEGEEELTRWLVEMLERIMDSIRTHRRYPQGVLLNAALAYISENLGGEVSRDQAARVACMSPSHFSRVVRERFGMTFTSLVAQMRVDRARELLKTSEMNLAEIALECGFPDQSYFTKVFRRIAGCTPSEYRQRERSGLR
ncbi:MAG: hypothetical protein KatS3mg024_1899 [Armatimonadota bacterium]|nr:MAG: hypothetical protein KatS3mg024_1899 [Armatimonadota bacterium]